MSCVQQQVDVAQTDPMRTDPDSAVAFIAGATAAANHEKDPTRNYVLYGTQDAMGFKLEKPKSEEQRRLEFEVEKQGAVGAERQNARAITERIATTAMQAGGVERQNTQAIVGIMRQHLWGKKFQPSHADTNDCSNCGMPLSAHHNAAPGHGGFCNSLVGKTFEDDPLSGTGKVTCKNCHRLREEHFPEQEGNSIVLCDSSEKNTLCKPTHSHIPFPILFGPSVFCGCPKPERYYEVRTLAGTMKYEDLGPLFFGRILFVLMIIFVAFWILFVIVDAPHAIMAIVPCMILVAIGYRWKNWRHQKQILKKFLQDEESRSREQAQLQGQLGFAVGRGGDHNVTLLQNDISEREDAEERVDSDSNSAQGLF